MKLNRQMFSIIALLVLASAPVAAVTIFNDGFNDGTLCSWGPSGCATITLVDTSATSPVTDTKGGIHEEWADFEVKFAVHAGNRDHFFEKESLRSMFPDFTKGFWFAIKDDNGNVYNAGITPFSMSAFCPCNDTGTHFKVAANTTRTFWLIVRLDNTGATAGTYRMRMTGLAYKFDGNNGDATMLITAGLENLVTPLKFVSNQNTFTVGGINAYEDLKIKLEKLREANPGMYSTP